VEIGPNKIRGSFFEYLNHLKYSKGALGIADSELTIIDSNQLSCRSRVTQFRFEFEMTRSSNLEVDATCASKIRILDKKELELEKMTCRHVYFTMAILLEMA